MSYLVNDINQDINYVKTGWGIFNVLFGFQ